ncbi:MAG: hypothetical protein J4F28_09625, partial [Nitrosopumilaceae archaeon]|nr:hypothetical protein [Nitrosopumilaceae archaeon]
FADASIIRDAEIGDFNAAVIYGPIYDGGAGVIITLEGWPPASAPYEGRVMPVDAPVSMELDAPALVHAGEYFPVTTHTVDSAGVPVELITESDRRDTGFAQAGGGTGLVEDAGLVLLSSLYDVGGAVQREVFSFLNVMSVDVAPGVPDMVKAGEPFELRAESLTVPTFLEIGDDDGTGDALDAVEHGLPVPGVSYELDVPPGWSAEQTEPGVFTVYPGTEGEFDLVVSGHRDGFDSEPTAITITSEMSVMLEVNAVLQDGGAAVSIPFSMQNGTSYDTP